MSGSVGLVRSDNGGLDWFLDSDGLEDYLAIKAFLFDLEVDGDDLYLGTYANGVYRGQQVPEPSTLVLFLVGIVGMVSYAWRRQKKAV